MTLSVEQEKILFEELRRLLAGSKGVTELPWTDLPEQSSILTDFDVDTLHEATIFLAAAGYFEGFVDHGATFSIRRGNSKLLLPGARHIPPYRKRMTRSPVGHLLRFALTVAILYLIRLGFRAFLLSLIS